jgi:hypothetical protein
VHRGVIDTAVQKKRRFRGRISSRIRSHIQQGLNPCISGLGGGMTLKPSVTSTFFAPFSVRIHNNEHILGLLSFKIIFSQNRPTLWSVEYWSFKELLVPTLELPEITCSIKSSEDVFRSSGWAKGTLVHTAGSIQILWFLFRPVSWAVIFGHEL